MEVKPSKKEEEKVKDISDEFLKKIKIRNAKVIVGGSGAKGTWLPGTNEIDIFVKFNYNHRNKDLSKLLEKELKKKFKRVVRIHGSRDYFRIKYKSFNFEVIPILNISNVRQAKNITDVSPFHVKWVKNNIKGLSDEIRLAKLFCKANKLYGAESYIRGFSGYALEILVIHYGSFKNLMRKASKWKVKQVIDPKKYHKNALKELNTAKIQSPFILIDPVQAERNVTAALSSEKFDKFRELSKKYLNKSSDKFFEIEKFDVKKLKGNLVLLKIEPLRGKRDVVGAKLLKCFNLIKRNLEEFKVIKSDWEWDKDAIFWFVLKEKKLSKYKKHYGPLFKQKKHLKAFKKKWKKYSVKKEGKKSYVMLPRKYKDIKTFMKNLIKDEDIKKRVKTIK